MFSHVPATPRHNYARYCYVLLVCRGWILSKDTDTEFTQRHSNKWKLISHLLEQHSLSTIIFLIYFYTKADC